MMESSTQKIVYPDRVGCTPIISVRNLSFSFRNSARQALNNLNLEIRQGEFVVITGLSGCGKSTLAMAMGGYIPHVVEGEMSGAVYIKGKDTRMVDLSDLAATISLCQQDPESQLCTLSVYDEVAFGPENLVLPADEVARRVHDSLAEVNASHLLHRHVTELSGGEKQRIAIASMLAMKPNVLVLDEPMSSLDPDSAAEVLRAIENLTADRHITIIVLEHRLDRLARLADRLIVMDSGQILLDGKPQEIYPVYRQMLSSPSSGIDMLRSAMKGGGARIQVDHLCFSYGSREILHDISFSAFSGEFIGIIGPNGSGKTTFLTCLTGLVHPGSGYLQVAEVSVMKAKTSDVARKVGFVFQNPNHQIFEKTVIEEMTFACSNFKIDDAKTLRYTQDVLQRYGLATYARSHPLRLSYGEKRRLNLGSVLPHDPDVIILDEPFIGQDAANCSRMINDLISLKAAGKTILIVSHDIDIIFRYCDRIVMFDRGRIVVDDAPEAAVEKIRAAGKPNYLPGIDI
ncbi:MAG TPA: energy-coupling factor transporter ATPase [Methanocella sp.]|nr:energy-coupling factor transporter ATPase [Methanocella sp.]